MNSEFLQYKCFVASLNNDERVKRDLYLKQINDGVIFGPLTGFPSIDKPWLKYYDERALTFNIPQLRIESHGTFDPIDILVEVTAVIIAGITN